MKIEELYDYLLKLQSIARIGLTYSTDEYAIDNYHQISDLTLNMLEKIENVKLHCNNVFKEGIYPTPNVSCRAVIINNKNEILLVREKNSGLYSIPGGWCDIYDSPKEAIINECRQEAGADIEVVRLIGILHKTPGNSCKAPTTIYELVFEANLIGELKEHEYETDDVKFFPIMNLPPMSKKMSMDEINKVINAQQEHEHFID